jgi:hypothetical protein
MYAITGPFRTSQREATLIQMNGNLFCAKGLAKVTIQVQIKDFANNDRFLLINGETFLFLSLMLIGSTSTVL